MKLSPLILLRTSIWILLPRNLGDHQTLSIYKHVGFHLTFMSLSHLIFDMLIYGRFYAR